MSDEESSQPNCDDESSSKEACSEDAPIAQLPGQTDHDITEPAQKSGEEATQQTQAADPERNDNGTVCTENDKDEGCVAVKSKVVGNWPRRNRVRSTRPEVGVELAIGNGPLEGAEPLTLGQLFQQRVQEFPDVAALRWKEQSVSEAGEATGTVWPWKTATYAEYYKSCTNAAKSLLKV